MKKVEEYYNLISAKYDKATFDFNWTAPKEIKSILEKYDLIKDGLEVLDLGVGTGQNVEFLQSKNCDIYGVDISEKMLEVVKDKYPNVKIYKHDICDGLSNLFQKDKFDLIIAGGILEFIKDIEKVFDDVSKIMKQNGHFIFTYEMLIPEDKIQNKREQYVSQGYKENIDLEEEFKLYRRSMEEVEKLLITNNFKILKHKKIKAFLKTENRIPVYYGVFLVRK